MTLGAGLCLGWITDERVWYAVALVILALTLTWTAWWLVRGARANIPLRTHPALWLILGVAGWGVAQLAMGWTVYPWITAWEVLRWGIYAAIVFLSLQLYADEAAREQFRRWLVWFCLVLTVVCLVQFFSFSSGGGTRILFFFQKVPVPTLGPFVAPDHYASLVALVMPFLLYEAIGRGAASIAWVPMVTAGAMYASMIAGGSRAGFAVVTLEIFVFFLLAQRRRRAGGRQIWLAAGALAAVAAVFVLAVDWSTLARRFAGADTSYMQNERREFNLVSMQLLQARPLTGFGLGTWTWDYPERARYDNGKFINAAHSDWLQWADEGGVPVLLAMLGVAILACRAVWGSAVWALGVVAVLVHCIVEFPLQLVYLTPVFFLCVGLAMARRAQS